MASSSSQGCSVGVGPLLVRQLAEQAAFMTPGQFATALGCAFAFLRLDEHDESAPREVHHREVSTEREEDEETKTLVSSRWVVPKARGNATVFLVPSTAASLATLTVGRASSCEVLVDVRSISRRHAALGIDNTGPTLRDLESENGTFVNGHRLRRDAALLRPLDIVTLADVRLLFLDMNTLYDGLAVLSD
ncbi:MAG: FHA domain-containing protein [Myxococcota bacterium]